MSEFLAVSPAEKALPTEMRFNEFIRSHLHTRVNSDDAYRRFGVYEAAFDPVLLPKSLVVFGQHIEDRGKDVFAVTNTLSMSTPVTLRDKDTNVVSEEVAHTRISLNRDGYYIEGSELPLDELDQQAFVNHILDSLEFLEITGGLNPIVPSDRGNFLYR